MFDFADEIEYRIVEGHRVACESLLTQEQHVLVNHTVLRQNRELGLLIILPLLES